MVNLVRALTMNDQGSLFPPSTEDKTLLVWNSVRGAFMLGKKLEILENYWRSFYRKKIIDWQKKENKELATFYPNYSLEGFQFFFEDCDHLELRFFLPTLEEINTIEFNNEKISMSDYSLVLEKILDDFKNKGGAMEWGQWDSRLSLYINWNMATYYEDEDFIKKQKRMEQILYWHGYEVDESLIDYSDFNILLSNDLVYNIQQNEDQAYLRIRTKLNILSKVYLIDMFDEDLDSFIFDWDSLRYWGARADDGPFIYFGESKDFTQN